MKTAITSSGSNLNSSFDKRFGRAAWFCIYSEEIHEIEFIKNNFAEFSEGAGQSAAKMMKELGVEKVISGDFGTKTLKQLDKIGIQMVVLDDTSLTIQKIISMIK